MRRHHLIEEAKAELDVAYEEVKRAEQDIMNLEYSFNEKIAALAPPDGSDREAALAAEKEQLQSAIDVATLYGIQKTAISRFALISSAFTTVASIEDVGMGVDLLRQLLFREAEIRGRKVRIDEMIRGFVKGLRAYTREESTAENDKLVRGAWADIEEVLRELGRDV